MTQIQSVPFRSRLLNVFLNNSLRVRLMSLMGITSLLTFLFCATIAVYFVYRTETTAWHGRQREAALAASQSVSAFVERAEDTLTYVARFDLAADPMILHDIVPMHPELLEVIRLDADGVVIASAYQDRAVLVNLFTIPLSQWFLRAKAGEHFYGGVQISSTDEPYLILAVPVPDGGVVAARLRMEILWSVVANIRFGESGRAYVINQHGQVIAHTDRSVVLNAANIERQPQLSTLLQSAEQEWSGEYVNFEGNAVVGVTAPIEITGWILVTEVSQAEAYAASRTALVVLVGSILLFTTLLLSLARSFLLWAVLRPMERLRIGAERIGQGDLDHRIDLHRHDEIGLVANAFDNMADNLRQREQQLAAQAASLLIEVKERTQTEVALRQSEARYRAIVEDQTELICRFQADGTLTFVNDAYCRYFGKQREELVGHTFMPFVPVEDRPLVETQFGSLSPENSATSYEHRVLLDDGEVRWMQWTDRLIVSGDGGLVEFQAVGRDITERRQVEEEIKLLNADLERRVAERTEQLASTNVELQNEITERRRVEDVLRTSEERLQIALRAAHAGVWEWNMNTSQTFWSEENYLVMGLDPKTAESRYDNWLRWVHPEDRQEVQAAVSLAVEQQSDLNIEFRVVWPDGSIHWINDVGKMMFDAAGRSVGMYGIQIDITERRMATERIKASLHEKEVLLKEIHHRVKNNLQIISSLLNLQSSNITSPAILAQFQDSQSRIRSMALIHERLYRSEDMANIEFGAYLHDMVASLVQTYRDQPQHIVISVDAGSVLLDIDKAIPCGLIVNELVSNALKHAFLDRHSGTICVGLSCDRAGQCQLTISDDGVGFAAYVQPRKTNSLGLQLVNSLTRQLGGTLEIVSPPGTTITIYFSNAPAHMLGYKEYS